MTPRKEATTATDAEVEQACLLTGILIAWGASSTFGSVSRRRGCCMREAALVRPRQEHVKCCVLTAPVRVVGLSTNFTGPHPRTIDQVSASDGARLAIVEPLAPRAPIWNVVHISDPQVPRRVLDVALNRLRVGVSHA